MTTIPNIPLTLDRPFVVIDLETTGVNPKTDRIVELSTVRYRPDGGLLTKRRLVNPTVKIPQGASDVHGITDDRVADAVTFAQLAKGLEQHLKDCDLGGYNLVSYDVPLLSAEFKRVGVTWPQFGIRIVDALAIFRHKEPQRHDLGTAVKHYLKRHHDGAHGAQADAEATMEVLMAQAALYGATSIDEMLALMKDPLWVDSSGKFKWIDGEPCVNFGKHSGTPLKRVDRGYLRWLTAQDFPTDTKHIAQQAINGKFPVSPV